MIGKKTLLGLAMTLCLIMAQQTLAKIIYVDAGATGSKNGASWANAFVYLQDAIGVAAANDEIRVAAGTYRPDQGAGKTPGDREASFVLKNLVKIKGGYPAGGGTTSDWNANKTYLSGDLNGDDAADTLVQNLLSATTRADNSYHVISSNLCGSPTLLDGFIVTGGQANGADTQGKGGGWFNITNGSPTISNCLFTYNAATTRGGGWYNEGANCKPTLTNVFFTKNFTAASGGAVAMLNTGADVKLNGCQFSENQSASNAGAIDMDISSPTIHNCVFSSNYAPSGGALYSNNTSSSVIDNTLFNDNSATSGGAVIIANNSMSFNGCIFKSNTATSGGAVYTSSNSLAMTECVFESNTATNGGAIHCYGTSPQITQSMFYNNHATQCGGAIYNYAAHPNLVSCRFIGNYSASYGGAICNQAIEGIGYGHAYLTGMNCLFVGNHTDNSGSLGGAIASFYHSYWNTWLTYVTFVNSTFYGNTSVSSGGGFYTNHSSSTNTLSNCILYGNADTSGGSYSESAQIHYGSNTIRSCCIQGLTAYVGNNNIGVDPLFVNPLGVDWLAGTMDDNLRLSSGSPCIDAGNNTLVPAELTTDMDGYPRFVDDPGTLDTGVGEPPMVDMGAYEFQVGFEDGALKAAVEAALGITNPTCDDMKKLITLVANNKGITSLVGLECATNLETLEVNSNKLTELNPLKNLAKLKTLKVAYNQLADVTPLSGCTELQVLLINNNLLNNAGVDPTLPNLTKLQTLQLGYNKLQTIPDLSMLTDLYSLYLHNNQITNICPLAVPEIDQLRTVWMHNNPLLTLESYMTCIPQIKANNSRLTDFRYDPGCTASLSCDVNKDCIVDLTDFMTMATQWLKCVHAYDAMCPGNGLE